MSKSLLAIGAIVGTMLGGAAHASIIPIGLLYSIQGTNAPNDFGPVLVDFDQQPKQIDGGLLTVSETQTPTGPNGEWDVFNVATTNGGPLAGSIDADWNFLGWSFFLSQPALFDGVSFWWTVDGTAVSGISNFSTICCAGPNPIDPTLGKYSSSFPGVLQNGVVVFNPTIFADPYGVIANGGIDPTTANDFHFGFHYTLPNSVPEPGALALLGMGLIGLGWTRRKRG